LISVNTQCNINKEIKKLIANNVLKLKINNDIYTNGSINLLTIVSFIKTGNNLKKKFNFFLDMDTDTGKSVITYYSPPLEIPTQV